MTRPAASSPDRRFQPQPEDTTHSKPSHHRRSKSGPRDEAAHQKKRPGPLPRRTTPTHLRTVRPSTTSTTPEPTDAESFPSYCMTCEKQLPSSTPVYCSAACRAHDLSPSSSFPGSKYIFPSSSSYTPSYSSSYTTTTPSTYTPYYSPPPSPRTSAPRDIVPRFSPTSYRDDEFSPPASPERDVSVMVMRPLPRRAGSRGGVDLVTPLGGGW